MAWTELVERRGQKEKHYYDPDTDKYRAVFSIHDQHFKDDFDDWIDVDENIVDDTGGFDKKCDTTRHIFQIASGGNRRWYPRRNILTEYVDITEIQYWSVNRWRTLNLPAAVWKSQGAEWDMANLYASITNTWRQIKTDFILKDNTAYTRLRFAISLTGLTYNHTTGELTSTTDGLVWGYIQKPTAKDANDADVPVTSSYDGTWIEWNVDTTGATFPIEIDPTFTDGYGGDVQTYKDTYLNAVNPDRDHSDIDQLNINDTTYRGLIEFDLSSISSSANCSSATFSLFISDTVACSVYVYELNNGNSNWIEGTGGDPETTGGATWDYRQQTGSGSGTEWNGSAGCSTSGAAKNTAGADYVSTAIGTFTLTGSEADGDEKQASLNTTAVATWFGASNTNNGCLLLRSTSNLRSFYSSDHSNTSVRPKLVVEYTEGACDTIVVMEVNTVVSVNTVVGMEG